MAVLDLNRLFPPAADGTHSPLPKQAEFLRLVLDAQGPQYVSYYGGFGSGKSVVLCTAMITQAVVYGGEYVIARHFMPELRRTTMKTFVELLPKELLIEHRVADAEVHIKSAKGKAVFYFVGLDDPGKLDSLNLSGWAIDEASQCPEEAFLKLQGRLRNPKGLRKGIMVGNPKGHDWVYRKFVSKLDIAPEKRSCYRMIVAPSTENKHLPEGYVEGMLGSYSKERVQRDIMGSFDSFEGMIYSEFDRHIHVIKPFEIPKDWTRVIGADHGFTNPAAFLWGAVDHDGSIYIYREYYERERLIKDIAQDLTRLNGKEKFDAIYIDPSTKKVSSQTGSSDWDTYLENIPKSWALIPARNDVEAGLDRVKTYLRVNEKTGKPKLFIFDSCHNVIEEISEYRYQELSPQMQGKANEKEAPRKYKDHAVDALRYLVMSRPEVPKNESPLKKLLDTPGLEGTLRRELYGIKKPTPKDEFRDL